MDKDGVKTDGEMKMEQLCTLQANLRAQLEQARKAEVSGRINKELIQANLTDLAKKISELERAGVKRFKVELKEAPQQNQPTIKPEVKGYGN